jgi:hypothetical protein
MGVSRRGRIPTSDRPTPRPGADDGRHPERLGDADRLRPEIQEGETMKAEGWYHDPYRLHEARWISDGTPTALVRDGGVESQDPPPATPFEGRLEPIEPIGEDTPTEGEDLLRADNEDPDGIFDPNAAVAVWDAFGESSGGD